MVLTAAVRHQDLVYLIAARSTSLLSVQKSNSSSNIGTYL